MEYATPHGTTVRHSFVLGDELIGNPFYATVRWTTPA